MRHVSPRRRVAIIAGALMLLLVAGFAIATDGEAHVSNMYATFWALVPPIIAIALALITKEVYSSLAIGIIAGALFHSNFN
ncbi:MAG: Na+/H+ antiporter NhaC family protein, partial [Clostridia bacterium]|nr:Na+/H+ antiporter NhaC family protein [Clostridia bacterium]